MCAVVTVVKYALSVFIVFRAVAEYSPVALAVGEQGDSRHACSIYIPVVGLVT